MKNPSNTSSGESDAIGELLNDDTAAAHIYPSTLKRFERGEHVDECTSIKVGNEDEESVGVFTIEQVRTALASLATQPAPAEPVARWIRVEDEVPSMYERVLVLTTDAEDDPHHALAHYNGSVGFLGVGGHRLSPVTHWQILDQPPADWKLPPPKPRNPKRRTATKGKE